MDPTDPAYWGQGDYTRRLLRLDDRFVLGSMAHAVRRCPIARLVDGYRQQLGS